MQIAPVGNWGCCQVCFTDLERKKQMKFKGLKALALLVALHAGLASAQDFSRFNWSRVQLTPGTASESFIDYSRISGDRVFGMRAWVMVVYEGITSAQMWGLSEISEVEVNCSKGTYRELKTIWTDGRYGQGPTAKTFMTANSAPIPITRMLDGTFQRSLFSHLCR